MESGKVYVVHNDWIKDPDDGNMPYKVGITKGSVSDRYYGIGLKMPGVFICDFAYEFSENYDKVEKALHDMLNKLNVNGEWFGINEGTLGGIQSICELLGGHLVAEDEEVMDDKEKVKFTSEDWKTKYPWVVDTAECLKELLIETIEKPEMKYKQYYIAITSASSTASKNVYFYFDRRGPFLSFRVKEEARDDLKELLRKNNIGHTLIGERKIDVKPINRQIIEQHKEVFIKIAEFVKDYKMRA